MSVEIIVVKGTYTRRNIDGGDGPSGYKATNSVSHSISNSVNNSAQNPNWRDDIRKGNCATTFLTGVKESLIRTPCSFSVQSHHGDFCRGNDVDDQLPWRCNDPSSLSVSLADSRARTKLIAKANEYQRPFTGGVALGELRETLRMIKRPGASLFKSISKHIDSISRKTRRLKPGSNPYRKAVSGSWLEANFGWAPLFSDIEDGAKALSRLANNASKRRKIVIANGKSEDISDVALSSDTKYGSIDVGCRYAYRQTNTVEVRYRAMLQWDSSLYSKFRYFGLTPSDILPTAWELVPWSFLIDYFANIGEMIEGFSFGTQRLRWVDRGEKKSSHRIFRTLYWYPNLSPNGPGEGWFNPEHLESRRETVRREEITNFSPVPDFHFEIPGSKQFANMAALFSNKRRLL